VNVLEQRWLIRPGHYAGDQSSVCFSGRKAKNGTGGEEGLAGNGKKQQVIRV
jgi:hypothetical protein